MSSNSIYCDFRIDKYIFFFPLILNASNVYGYLRARYAYIYVPIPITDRTARRRYPGGGAFRMEHAYFSRTRSLVRERVRIRFSSADGARVSHTMHVFCDIYKTYEWNADQNQQSCVERRVQWISQYSRTVQRSSGGAGWFSKGKGILKAFFVYFRFYSNSRRIGPRYTGTAPNLSVNWNRDVQKGYIYVYVFFKNMYRYVYIFLKICLHRICIKYQCRTDVMWIAWKVSVLFFF